MARAFGILVRGRHGSRRLHESAGGEPAQRPAGESQPEVRASPPSDTAHRCRGTDRRGARMAVTVESRQHGGNRLILGIVLAVITFWLFAQTTLNVAPEMRRDLRIAESASNIAVTITALFSGIFIVVAGGLADQFGRMRFTNLGLVLSILGSLLIAVSPGGTATFLIIGRVIQGISAACIMPATLALMKAYFDGKERQ